MLLEEEKRKIEETKKKFLEDEMKRKLEEEKKRVVEEEMKKKTQGDKKKILEEEEKEKERKEREEKEEVEKKQREDDTKPSSLSTLLSLASLTTKGDDQNDLISSFSKLIQKKNIVKSLQRTLMEVTNRLHSTLAVQHIEVDPKQRAHVVLKSFDEEITNLLNVAETKTQISHDANLFRTICQNIKNDLISLDTCIKQLQKFQ